MGDGTVHKTVNTLFHSVLLVSRLPPVAMFILLSILNNILLSPISHFKCYLSHIEHHKRLMKGESIMAKVSKQSSSGTKSKLKPALTPEARENQLIYLATDLAEQQLRDGTASSQVITHYLKLGSSKERLEKEILAENKKLLAAKTESLQSSKRIEELYTNAIAAMRRYSGNGGEEDEEEEY